MRPAKLHEARTRRARKNITAEKLREIEDESIREVVKLQEDAGLHGITDGELRRDYWHLDFLTRIGCNELQGYLLSHPVEEKQIDAIFLGEKAAPEPPVADAA